MSNQVISVVSESMPHLRKGAMRDFESIMRMQGYWEEKRWNATNSVYTFPKNNIIEFFSADDSDKVRGPRRDVLFVNEANNIGLETFTQLEIRTRKIVWLDWNPVSEFWWYTDVAPFYHHDFLVLTYKDNEALLQSEVEAFEAHRNNPNRINWWKVYGEGQLGEAEGRVYKGWQLIDEIPYEARLESYGLDFGYTNDPTAIVSDYIFNGGHIFHEEAYTKGLSNKQISDILLNLPRALVLADSSEPKSVDEIKSYGVSIVGALKGQGSVLQGIQYVQDQRVSVTKTSTNLLKEYRSYLWLVDPKTSKSLNEPVPFNNHAMDAIRYALSKNFVDIDKTDFNLPNKELLKDLGIENEFGGTVGYGIEGFDLPKH
jgi:phage terminase large subunit